MVAKRGDVGNVGDGSAGGGGGGDRIAGGGAWVWGSPGTGGRSCSDSSSSDSDPALGDFRGVPGRGRAAAVQILASEQRRACWEPNLPLIPGVAPVGHRERGTNWLGSEEGLLANISSV